MKLAISSTGDLPESEVDLRFGRCKYFMMYDEDAKKYEAIENSAQFASGGAGVQAAAWVVNSGAKVVLTGNVGPKAFQVLSSSDVRVVTNVNGTVKGVVDRYVAGELTAEQEPSVEAHFGLR